MQQPAGVRHANWRGGVHRSRGYVRVTAPEHPRADTHGYVAEHVLVVERALGHLLASTHPVHHVDEDRGNNLPTNLVACEDDAYHKLLHRRQRALGACGDANAQLCHICKRYDHQDDITVSTSDARGYQRAYHRVCAANRERLRRAKAS